MPKQTADSLRLLCRKRIAATRRLGNPSDQFEDRIFKSLCENLASGRFERFVAGSDRRQRLGLPDYVDRIIFHTEREFQRVKALEQGDPTEWNRLHETLFRRACRMIQPFRNGTDANMEARDFSQQACLIIFDQRYPFDVAFDAWATTILKNLVVAHYTRSSDVLRRPNAPSSLDVPLRTEDGSVASLGDLLADAKSLAPFERVENQALLLDAIDQLRSSEQRNVIVWTFLDGLSDKQIAKRLGKSVQATYNLRWRALKRLRNILESPRKKTR